MSVSVRVEFDRDSRVYSAGEPVTGRVVVETDRGEDCLGVSLTRGWRLHGMGTTDWNQGPYVYPIHEGPLPGGPVHRIPFDVPAPTDALTYDGGLFEVQHFIEAEVGFPHSAVSMQEALDASTSAIITVLPGPLMKPPPPTLLQASAVVVAARNHSAAGQAAISGATSAQDLQRISTILEGWPNLRRWVAERRVGPVTAHFSSRVVSPGDQLKVKLRFEPRVPILLNGASLRLQAQEISVSVVQRGSSGLGEGREERQNTLCSLVRGFSGPRRLDPGMVTFLHAEVEVPQTDAFTVISAHHQLVWSATVNVDIPTWPDWERAFALVAWPEVSRDPQEETPTAAEDEDGDRISQEIPEEVLEKVSSMFPTDTQVTEETAPEEFQDLEAQIRTLWDSGSQIEAASPGISEFPLTEAVRAIRAEKIIGGNRDGRIKALEGMEVQFDLTVRKIERTMGMYSDPDYRDGRTVRGEIAGTDIGASVSYPASSSDQIDSLEPGSTYPIRGSVSAWDTLRREPKILSDSAPSTPPREPVPPRESDPTGPG